jgi:hypothetical protein
VLHLPFRATQQCKKVYLLFVRDTAIKMLVKFRACAFSHLATAAKFCDNLSATYPKSTFFSL